ncbi:MAG TPA: hypothetical protein VIS48_16330 [Candidatus Kryptonia bacterium]
MKLKILERVFSVALVGVWILLLLRAHALRPIAFYQMQPILYVGDVAVLLVAVLSLSTKRPLFSDKKTEEEVPPEIKIEE